MFLRNLGVPGRPPPARRVLLGLPAPLPRAVSELCGPAPAAPGQATAVPAGVGGRVLPAHLPCVPPGTPPGTERHRRAVGALAAEGESREKALLRCPRRNQHPHHGDGGLPRGVRLKANGGGKTPLKQKEGVC